jgi:hypothetical protein
MALDETTRTCLSRKLNASIFASAAALYSYQILMTADGQMSGMPAADHG